MHWSQVLIFLFLFLKIIISDHVQQTCDFVAFALKLQ